MRRFSQVQGLNLHLGLIAPFQQAASPETTLHRMSLSVTPRTELLVLKWRSKSAGQDLGISSLMPLLSE